MTEPAEEQIEPSRIVRPVPCLSGGEADDSNPFEPMLATPAGALPAQQKPNRLSSKVATAISQQANEAQ